MAKQTFTTGQVLTAAQMTDLQQTAMTGGAASTKTVSYVLVAADAGTRIAMNAAGSTTITVNTGLFSAGDTVSIQNIGAGVCTVTAGTATVNTSGSLVLAQYQGGILYFTSASAAIFFQFATPASGDIEGVTAGTGISGGGTSGTVTITNSMATEITAAGDIIVGTGNATFDNLPIGSTGQILTADTTVSPYKVKWATPATGAAALTKITSGTFSNQSSVAVDSVFSSTYRNYMAVIQLLAATGSDDGQLQLRYAGPTTQTTTYYNGGFSYNSSNALTTFGAANASQCTISPTLGTGGGSSVFTVYFSKVGNSVNDNGIFFGSGIGGEGQHICNFSSLQDTQRNYTGFLIKSSSSNITGSYAVYGLEN